MATFTSCLTDDVVYYQARSEKLAVTNAKHFQGICYRKVTKRLR